MKKLITDDIRKNVGRIASTREGKELRAAICESLTAVAELLDAEEIPIRKLVLKSYLKGAFIGAVAMQAVFIVILIIANMR